MWTRRRRWTRLEVRAENEETRYVAYVCMLRLGSWELVRRLQVGRTALRTLHSTDPETYPHPHPHPHPQTRTPAPARISPIDVYSTEPDTRALLSCIHPGESGDEWEQECDGACE